MSLIDTPIGPVELHAQGGGPTAALLLHAAASGPRALHKLASALAAASMATLAPALHGYGASRVDGASEPFAAHVAIARWALTRLPAGRRILVGHSLGGLIALLALLEGAEVDAAVLYEPITLFALEADDAEDAAARAWDGRQIETLATRVAASDPETGVAAFVEAYNEVRWSSLPEALRLDLVAKAPNLVAETDSAQRLTVDRAALARLALPILILQGERSPAVTHRMSLKLARLLPNARREIVAGAGHMGPVMAPAAVAAATTAFLAELR